MNILALLFCATILSTLLFLGLALYNFQKNITNTLLFLGFPQKRKDDRAVKFILGLIAAPVSIAKVLVCIILGIILGLVISLLFWFLCATRILDSRQPKLVRLRSKPWTAFFILPICYNKLRIKNMFSASPQMRVGRGVEIFTNTAPFPLLKPKRGELFINRIYK